LRACRCITPYRSWEQILALDATGKIHVSFLDDLFPKMRKPICVCPNNHTEESPPAQIGNPCACGALVVGIFALTSSANDLLLRLLISVSTQSFSWGALPFAFFLLFAWALLGWIWWAANPVFRRFCQGEVPVLRRILYWFEAKEMVAWNELMDDAQTEWNLLMQATNRADPNQPSFRRMIW
jgi:hypothetical protein